MAITLKLYVLEQQTMHQIFVLETLFQVT